MSYKLFLDDERMPHAVTWVEMPLGPWEIVRSYDQFVNYITENGIPSFISFDHDLSVEDQGKNPNKSQFKEKTGYDCAKWLVEKCMNENRMFPKYQVHSMNPIGAMNIRAYIECYKNTIK
jgi:hypothetical protein